MCTKMLNRSKVIKKSILEFLFCLLVSSKTEWCFCFQVQSEKTSMCIFNPNEMRAKYGAHYTKYGFMLQNIMDVDSILNSSPDLHA